MSDIKKPSIASYGKHVFVCTGPRCAPDTSNSVYQHLKSKLKELKLNEGPNKIHRSQAHCFGICEGGPLAIVYPEGVWYCHLDNQKVDKIIQQHLIEGKPVEECMMHHMENDKK
jgi:(2Fe-2S) ferredoxin